MNKQEALNYYKEYRSKLAAYNLVVQTTCFDKETVASQEGNTYRNQKLAFMAGEIYQIETDPKALEVINYLSTCKLNETMTREIQLVSKALESTTKFTKEETMEWDLLCSDSWDAWYKAKTTNDYSVFAPYLTKLIEKSKERAIRRNPDRNPYDVMLDDFEEGMTMKDYDAFFHLIKSELLPLIHLVNQKQNAVDDSFMHLCYSIDKQKKFCEKLLKYLGFTNKWGYMGISEHPFTNSMSRSDVRITTSYDDHNIMSTIFSVIHETGHAYYEHQIDSRYDDMMIRYMISSGMHESQSRFLENYIGRRPAFWSKLYPRLQKAFPANLKNITKEQFTAGLSAARSSLVRTEADELTYPIHILIRYEIEKGIFDGSISTEHLDQVWNQKYKEYLGIDVPGDKEGILQDVHWSTAAFGYFPTYALGSAIGAQLLHAMQKELDIDELLSKGKISEIERWLKNKVQHDGAMHSYNDILIRATGEPFNPHYYIDYLKKKYTELYQL